LETKSDFNNSEQNRTPFTNAIQELPACFSKNLNGSKEQDDPQDE